MLPSEPRTLLDRLQQESWQLELLVSGFAIFLLIGGWGPYQDLLTAAGRLLGESAAYFMLYLTLGLLSVAYLALIVSLIVHVVIRGMWIAAIGLRSVSGDLDYDALAYRPRYVRFLQRAHGSFDQYIERLERYSSVVFSVAFLIIFCFVSLTSYFLLVMTMQWIVIWLTDGYWSGTGVFGNAGLVDLVMLIIGVIYLIDFFSLGAFKRGRYTAAAYYPIYRFVGWITLANLYRPLYHNLIDDRFGRRLARLLPVIVVGLLVVASIRIVTNTYFPAYLSDGRVWIDANSYEAGREDYRGRSQLVTLADRYPHEGYIELFWPYLGRQTDPVIRRRFPDLEVARYTGVRMGEPIQIGERFNRDVSQYDELLEAFTSILELYVDDSLRTDVQPRFYDHPQRQQAGLLYVIPVRDLPPGEHTVRLRQQRLRGGDLYWQALPVIYFYQ